MTRIRCAGSAGSVDPVKVYTCAALTPAVRDALKELGRAAARELLDDAGYRRWLDAGAPVHILRERR